LIVDRESSFVGSTTKSVSMSTPTTSRISSRGAKRTPSAPGKERFDVAST
jgi:hypothetical protein